MSLVCLLLFGSVIQVNAENTVETNLINFQDENYKVEILIDTESHQKIKFTNLDTNEVEYLESFLTNGEYMYEVNNSDGVQTITTEGNEIIIADKNNKIKTFNKNKLLDKIHTIQNTSQESTIQPFGLYDDVPKNTPWVVYSSYNSSTELNVATVSLIAGILASIYGGPVNGVIITAASYLSGIKAKRSYYKVVKETRIVNGQRQIRRIVSYYKYHDYTGFLGTTYETPRNVCFSCLY